MTERRSVAAEGFLRLDESQEAAVSQQSGPVVVLGQPGSGKTTVVVERAAFLVRSGVSGDEILVLALSRGNSNELTGRLATRLGRDAPAVMTVHAFAYGLVRRHYRLAGYARPPRWFRAREAWQRLRRALERQDTSQWHHYQNGARSRTILALVNDLVAGVSNNALEAGEACSALRAAGRADLEELAHFVQAYQALLKRECLLDAETAVLEGLRLLDKQPDLVAQYRRQYPHVLVDEFEQATFAQSRLVCLLAAQGMFVVGNPDEATNSFRGGSPACIRDLARLPETNVVCLEVVHRGSPGIREAYRRVFSATTGTGPELNDNDEVVIRNFEHQREEVAWLAKEIVALVRNGAQPGDMAVLFRRGGDPVARDLASALHSLGMPLHAMEQAVSVASDPMVASSVDVLRYLSAPDGERYALFLRLLASPLGGLTPSEVRWVRRLASEQRCSPLVLAANAPLLESLPPRLAESTAGLAPRLHELEAYAAAPSDDLLWRIWTSFPAFAAQSLAWGCGHFDEVVGCPTAFRAFLEEVSRIVQDTPSTTIVDLIRLFDSGHFQEITVVPSLGNGAGVHLGTIHEARGREWQAVFIPNLVEDVYPLRRSPIGSLASILLRGGDGEPELVRERHLAEERRVLGMAISRARARLYVSYSAVAFDGTTRLAPSRYLQLIGSPVPGSEPAPASADPVEGASARYRRALWGLDHVLNTTESDLEDRLAAAEALSGLAQLSENYPDRVDPSRWWDLIEETQGARHPYPDGVLYLSASRLGAYRDCPLKFKFAQHLSLDDVSSDAMTLGTLLHAVLEEYHRPGGRCPRGRETLEQLLDSYFDESQFSRPAIARQVRRKAGELLDLYFPLYGWHGEALAVEQLFRLQLGPHHVSGRIDRIDKLLDGSLELIDYKTGGAMTLEEARGDLQLALYELAFRRAPELVKLGRPSIVTYLYPKAISQKLAAKLAEGGGPPAKSTRGRGDGKRSYCPTDEGRERLLSRIDRYASGILAEQFPSRSFVLRTWPDLDPDEVKQFQKSDPCRNCGFKWLCPETERGASNGRVLSEQGSARRPGGWSTAASPGRRRNRQDDRPDAQDREPGCRGEGAAGPNPGANLRGQGGRGDEPAAGGSPRRPGAGERRQGGSLFDLPLLRCRDHSRLCPSPWDGERLPGPIHARMLATALAHPGHHGLRADRATDDRARQRHRRYARLLLPGKGPSCGSRSAPILPE